MTDAELVKVLRGDPCGVLTTDLLRAADRIEAMGAETAEFVRAWGGETLTLGEQLEQAGVRSVADLIVPNPAYEDGVALFGAALQPRNTP